MQDKQAVDLLWARSRQERYSKLLDIEVLEIAPGFAKVAMDFRPDMTNIFGMLHGGAVFSLLDEAFQLACNAHGEVAVALQLSIYYLAPAEAGVRLLAEAKETNATRKTALYDALVYQADGKRIATGQALAYRKGQPLPFDSQGELLSKQVK
ncbi:MAG: hotdog fold thioesterase [Pseudomonadota bacterium]